MDDTPWKAESPCPQCGGPVSLEAGDPLLDCGFCRTRLYLAPSGPLSYLLPAAGTGSVPAAKPASGPGASATRAPAEGQGSSRATTGSAAEDSTSRRAPSSLPTESLPGSSADEETLHIPFWRLRGHAFQVREGGKIAGRLLDVTLPAAGSPFGAAGLGLHPQLTPLRLAVGGERLPPPRVSALEALRRTEKRLGIQEGPPPLHECFVGESRCLIYAPLRLRGGLPDGGCTASRAWEPRSAEARLAEAQTRRLRAAMRSPAPGDPVRFLPLLCPECAADLPAAPHALALTCGRCSRTWEAAGGRFVPLAVRVLRPGRTAGKARLFPFWNLELALEGLPFTDRAGMRRAVIPYQRPPAAWAGQPVELLVPAFRLGPEPFLRLARRLSIVPYTVTPAEEGPRFDEEAEAVRLPAREAAEAAHLVLFAIFRERRLVLPLLPGARLRIRRTGLLYIPWQLRGSDWVEPFSGQALAAAALARGRRL